MARSSLASGQLAQSSSVAAEDDFSDSDDSQQSGPTPRPVFKDSHVTFVKRMQKLYPYVDQKKKPLPSSWNSDDRNELLGIAEMGLRVYFKGKNPKDPASIRADHPIPINCGVYYFEVKIVKGQQGCMGIGLCEKSVSLNRLPGWDRYSYGYHGDDGHFFSFSGNGDTYGPTFSSGDVVGCGIDLIDRHIFFTKNGKNLGVAAREVERVEELFPTVGLQTAGEVVEANFGQRPFVFDIQKEIRAVRESIYKTILDVDLPAEKNDWFNEAVASFLSHAGFPKALAAFNKETKRTVYEANAVVDSRGRIKNLVLNRRFGEAIRAIEENHPGLLATNKELNLVLHCQQFIDMALDLAKQEAKSATGTTGSSAVPFLGAGTSSRLAGSSSGVVGLEALSLQTINPLKRRGSRTDSETRRASGSVGADEVVEFAEATEGDNEKDEVDEEPARRRRTPHSRRITGGRPDSSTSSNGAAAAAHLQDVVMEEVGNGDARNGTSHSNGREKNGTYKNGNAAGPPDTTTFIVSEEDDEEEILDAPIEEATTVAEAHSFYSPAEMTGYEKYSPLRTFGQKIHEISRMCSRMPKELKSYVNESLSMICISDVTTIEQSPLRSPEHVETLAAAVNSAIREFSNEPSQSLLSRRFVQARDSRNEMLNARILAGLFAETELMIFGGDPIPVPQSSSTQGIF